MDIDITAPKGFVAGGAHIGIKKAKRDLALVASEVGAVAAGCFTKNIVKAAPVLYDQQIIDAGKKTRGIMSGACSRTGRIELKSTTLQSRRR